MSENVNMARGCREVGELSTLQSSIVQVFNGQRNENRSSPRYVPRMYTSKYIAALLQVLRRSWSPSHVSWTRVKC
jgi:hypothetical protein